MWVGKQRGCQPGCCALKRLWASQRRGAVPLVLAGMQMQALVMLRSTEMDWVYEDASGGVGVGVGWGGGTVRGTGLPACQGLPGVLWCEAGCLTTALPCSLSAGDTGGGTGSGRGLLMGQGWQVRPDGVYGQYL